MQSFLVPGRVACKGRAGSRGGPRVAAAVGMRRTWGRMENGLDGDAMGMEMRRGRGRGRGLGWVIGLRGSSLGL